MKHKAVNRLQVFEAMADRVSPLHVRVGATQPTGFGRRRISALNLVRCSLLVFRNLQTIEN